MNIELILNLVSLSLLKFQHLSVLLSSIIIASLGLVNSAHSISATDQISANEQITDQNSIFYQASKIAQFNTFSDTTNSFSFSPPTGWALGSSTNNQSAYFTKDSGGTLASLAIDYVPGSPLPDSIFSLPDETILDAVANGMLNSSQPIVGKSMQKFSDGMKFKVVYASQGSQQISTKSEQILLWLKDGKQYYFTMICDNYNFNKNSADFESAVNTFDLISAQSNQQIAIQTQIPSWIKNNAKWWSEGSVTDDDFVKGIQYLMQNGIMKVPPGKSTGGSSHQIPIWVKHNAGWWASGEISDDDFVKGIQYLVTSGIIKT